MFCFLKNNTKSLITIKSKDLKFPIVLGPEGTKNSETGIDKKIYDILEKEIKSFSRPGHISLTFTQSKAIPAQKSIPTLQEPEKIDQESQVVEFTEKSSTELNNKPQEKSEQVKSAVAKSKTNNKPAKPVNKNTKSTVNKPVESNESIASVSLNEKSLGEE
jgi:hypothetical protein